MFSKKRNFFVFLILAFGLATSIFFILTVITRGKSVNLIESSTFENFKLLNSNEHKLYFLCYIDNQEDIDISCFNKENGHFEYIGIINYPEITFYDDVEDDFNTVQALALDLSTGKINKIENNDDFYLDQLLELLNNWSLDSFKISYDSSDDITYIDLFDYTATKTILLKFYSNTENVERFNQIKKEMDDDILSSDTFSIKYYPICPVNMEDIEYISAINNNFYSVFYRYSEIYLSDFFLNLDLFNQMSEEENLDDIEASLRLVELYKIYKFVNSTGDLGEGQSLLLQEYEKELLSQSNLTGEEMGIFLDYIPVTESYILDYFLELKDEKDFVSEVIKMDYYLYRSYNFMYQKYKIPNILLIKMDEIK